MSRIPVPRDSIASHATTKTTRSKIPQPKKSIARNSIAPSESAASSTSNRSQIPTLHKQKADQFFIKIPTAKLLRERKLPSSLTDSNMIFGRNEKIAILFEYTKKLSESLFHRKIHKLFFPIEFVVEPNPTSKIATLKKQETKIDNFSLNDCFGFLNVLFEKDIKKSLAITDFVFLYLTLVMSTCSTSNSKYVLDCAIKFLELEVTRFDEARLFMDTIIRRPYKREETIQKVVKIVNSLLHLNSEFIPIIHKNTKSNNEQVAKICKRVLKEETFEFQEQVAITPKKESAEDKAIRRITDLMETVGDELSPSLAIELLQNIVNTMEKFHNSSKVLACGSQFLNACFDLIPINEAPKIIHKLCSILFPILAADVFLEGEDSIDAQTAIDELINHVFDEASEDLLDGIAVSTIESGSLNCTKECIERLHRELRNGANLSFGFASLLFSRFPKASWPVWIPRPDRTAALIALAERPGHALEGIEALLAASEDGRFEDVPEYLAFVLRDLWAGKCDDRLPSDVIWARAQEVCAE